MIFKKNKLLALAALVLTASLFLTGCSPEWRKKFVRKSKKEKEAPQAVLVLEPDYKSVHPPADRYREHFAFWKTWHAELLISLGQIQKRDVRYLNGVIGELRSMQALLQGPPAGRLREILVELTHLQQEWENAPAGWHVPHAHRTRLEKLQREVNNHFSYNDVKDSIAQDPAPEPAPAEAAAEKPAPAPATPAP